MLLLQVWISLGLYGDLLGALSGVSQYFTVLTNLLVLVAMGAVGLGRRPPGKAVWAVVVAIAGVGVVYHAVLAQLWQPQGMAWLADQGLHTIVPVLTVAWWLAFAPRRAAGWRDLPLAVIWPLTYCIYALARAEFSGFYPYPFIDLPALGWGGLFRNVAILVGLFIVLAGLLVGGKSLTGHFARS
jgi:hypothetical protein